ncbi:hypothetical protein TTHERM_00122200 (macronuclear) [Tetrahymena thermophila SB210]|uniref:Uncharacterized protein n=1 Tax=Tetrahymena thermophila (strain SB210) TaxID=312017 RepID=Q22YV0_TETTS|nr:hypothetical protein TTHERM_00122200 [Tetrahymena thermophila SB210]EAR90571.2 hypothetical protein TTHERM_00122200 [Tetrahymena thermophila SB210]|eukprot:XP_001010816.2 hypothetical protein TTHERM_00122200 [Tetrahymena thermophila SB210]
MSDNLQSNQINIFSNMQRGSILAQQLPSFTAINTPKGLSGSKPRQYSIVFTLPQSGKQAQIRIDSPRTQLAMKQLGILPSSLQQKQLDDFKGPNVTEKIQQLRYEHHQERLIQDYISIMRQRKEIMKREREQALKLNESITSNNNNNNFFAKQRQPNKESQNQSVASTKANTAISGARQDRQQFFLQPHISSGQNKDIPLQKITSFGNTNNRTSKDNLNITSANNINFKSFYQKPTLHYRSFSEYKVDPLHMSQLFDKTVKYLRSSHETPEVQEGSIVLNNNGDEVSQDFDPFESQMEKEINRFNKLKLQKQKEAKFIYLDDLKRQKMIEEMAEREKKMTEFKIREEIKKQQKKEKDRERALEKLEQIRSLNKAQEDEKFKQKQEVMKRLEEIKQKQNEQSVQNEQEQEQKRRKRRERNEKISRAKSECQMRDLKESQKQYKQLLNKMMISEEQYKQKIQEKQQKMKERLSQEEMRLDNFIQTQKYKEKLNFSQFVEKLQDKDQKHKQNMEKQIRMDISLQQLKKEKEERLKENQLGVYRENQQKKIQLNNKFKQIEENRIKKQQEIEETCKLKQELRNLKLDYIHENFDRQHRINDYKLEQMLEKEKQHQDNIAAIRNQRELIQQAKKEVYSQYKLEGDRINEGIKIIQDNLFPTQITPVPKNHAKKGIKVLSKIFKQEQEEQIELQQRLFPQKNSPSQQNNINNNNSNINNSMGSQINIRD